MANGDSKFRSRKFLIATASFVVVTVFAAFSLVFLCEDAGDAALVMGTWAGSDSAILGLYSHFNVKMAGG